MEINSKKKHVLGQMLCWTLTFISIVVLVVSILLSFFKGGTIILSGLIVAGLIMACVSTLVSDYLQRKYDEHEYKKWR